MYTIQIYIYNIYIYIYIYIHDCHQVQKLSYSHNEHHLVLRDK